MQRLPQLSIIIPVYNTETFLSQCIESALQQTRNLAVEVILIDDGSTDKSGLLCDKFSRKYSNVLVQHMQHSGVVTAREQAVRLSHGCFVTFLDSDDWLDVGCFDEVIRQMSMHSEIDISVIGMVRSLSDGTEERICSYMLPVSMDHVSATIDMMNFKHFRWELCGKVYRKDLFSHITFSPNDTVAEDLDANWQLFRVARRVFYFGEKNYHYRVNPNSVTESFLPSVASSVGVFDRIWNNLWIKDESVLNVVYRGYIGAIESLAREYYFCNKNDEYRDEIEDLILKHRCIIKQSQNLTLNRPDKARFFSLDYQDGKKMFASMMKNMIDIVKKVSRTDYPIYIYGTGNVAKYVSRLFFALHVDFEGFIVSNDKFRKQYFAGKKIYTYSDLCRLNGRKNIVIAMISKNRKEIMPSLHNSDYVYFFDAEPIF